MKLKLLGSLVIGVMLVLGGCRKGGSQQGENGNDGGTSEQQEPATDQRQMPEQLQQMQQQDIEVSNEEVQKFVEAVQEVQTLSREAQQEVGQAVEEGEMSSERFNEIYRSQQSQDPGQANATEEEMQQFQNIMQKMQDVQSGVQEEMQTAIEDVGLTIQRYQQIAKAAQSDSSLMMRIQEEMGGSMGGPE